MKIYIVISHEDAYITAEKAFYNKEQAEKFALKFAKEHWLNVDIEECELI